MFRPCSLTKLASRATIKNGEKPPDWFEEKTFQAQHTQEEKVVNIIECGRTNVLGDCDQSTCNLREMC